MDILQITFQAIVLTAAVMFIFLGYPIHYCVLSVPIVLIGAYMSIYASHSLKALEIFHVILIVL